MVLGRLLAIYLLFASLPMVARQSADDAPVLCVLEGTAVDFATAEPLRKVTVRLTSSNRTAPEQMAITDASGHLHLENIPEGDYELTGERTGYLKSEWGARQPGGNGTPLRLKAGDRFTDLTLKLAHGSAISGKVVDENGDPFKTVVHVLSRGWIRGQSVYFVPQSVWTNDAGEYRIVNLPPGRYYLFAEGSTESFVEKQGGPEKQTVWSFYPNSRTLDNASPLDLSAGQDLQGIDLQLPVEPVFHIRGRLAGGGVYGPGNGLTLSAHPHNAGDDAIDLNNKREEGKTFDFSGAPAGIYDIELLSEEYHQTIARISVEIKKSNRNGLVIPVPDKFNLKGVVHRLDTASAAFLQLTVSASDHNSPLMSHPYWTDIQSDSSFKIEGVWPGQYVFGLTGLGQGDYVKSIQLGGQEVLGIPVDLAGNTGPLEMTISGGAGRMSGSIQSADSNTPVGGLQVVLVSEPPRFGLNGVLLAKTDQNGHVEFENVPPGRYYAFAVTDSKAGLFENRNVLEQLRGNGVEIEMPENGNLQIRIPIVSAEDVQRALSILGL